MCDAVEGVCVTEEPLRSSPLPHEMEEGFFQISSGTQDRVVFPTLAAEAEGLQQLRPGQDHIYAGVDPEEQAKKGERPPQVSRLCVKPSNLHTGPSASEEMAILLWKNEDQAFPSTQQLR